MISKLFSSFFAALFYLTIALFSFGVSGPALAANENVMLILDASGSMWGRVDGQPKIEIAREVVGNVLRDVGSKVNLGVIAYGHRSKGECRDIQTIIPVGPVDADAYMSVINKISPKGKTPITDAVRKAANELKYKEEKATIILVSDGLETCDANPCALARQLEKQGIDFTVHVVGFDLKDQDTRSLQCLAKQTGGKYLSAGNTGELADAIGSVVAGVKPPEPKPDPVLKPTLLKVEVLYTQGQKVERAYVYVIPVEAEGDRRKAAAVGSNSRPYKVKPGKYHLETKVGSAIGTAEVEVVENKMTTAQIVLNAGLLKVQALPKEGGKPLTQAYIYIYKNTGQTDGKRKQVAAGNQRNVFTLPAGKYFITAQVGKAKVGKEIDVAAGKRTDATIILASGLLKIDALAQAGGKPQKDAYIYVYETETQTNGKRKQVTAGNQRNKFSLPAGKYFVTAQIGKARVAQEIEVVAGKMTQVAIIVGVGVLKVNVVPAEGAKPLRNAYVNIFETEKQMDGKRKRVTSANARTNFKLPAGTYHVIARVGKAATTKEINVTAGKRTEITLNVNAGSLSVKAVPAKIFYQVLSVEKNMDGTRDRIANGRARGKPFILPAGKYVITAKDKGKSTEIEVEVKAGKLTEIELKLQ